jgi:crotonobetainyl-CoA:carnitine CoA-transferase CaiB-like acyl-CoA transferase
VAGSLEGITILDLSQHLAGHMATLVLGEQGADVIKVEPPGGDPLRQVEPAYFIRNRSKRSITLDLNNPEQRDTLLKLAERADVLVESSGRDHMARLGLDYQSLRDRFPALVYCSINGYGDDHPWRNRPIHDGLIAARMGLYFDQPGDYVDPEKDAPVYLYCQFPSYATSFTISIGILAALRVRLHSGAGQAVECALHDGMMLITPLMWMWADNPNPTFAARTQLRAPYRPWLYECADGKWLHRMQTAKGNVVAIAKVLGIEMPAGITRDRLMANVEQRKWFEQQEIAAMKKRPREEWIKLLREIDVPVEAVLPTEEALFVPQARANEVVAEIDDPKRGHVVQMGLPFRFSKTQGAIKGLAPEAGEHTREIITALNRPAENRATAKAIKPRPLRHPLFDTVLIDFGHYAAGPFGPMLLSDLGAKVIKVETIEGEGMRQPFQPFFISQRGKRTIAVDLKSEEGREIAYKLVADADIVHHNQRPGVAERLKIDYATLSKIKPDLIYTHVPAYGTRGPQCHEGGYDQLFQAMCGMEYMGGGEGNDPVWNRYGPVDMCAATLSVIATLMALCHRDRTGEGQFVDTSLLNAGLYVNSDAFVTDRDDVRRRPTMDRTQTGISADYRFYATSEGWIFVAAQLEGQWRRLCEVVGKPQLAGDPRYRTHYDRVDRRYELAEVIEPIFKSRSAQQWFEALDAAGVPCEIINKGYWERWLLDPWSVLTKRVTEYYEKQTQSRLRMMGEKIRFSQTPEFVQGPPPRLGEDTQEILHQLGYNAAQRLELKERKIVTWPDKVA